MAGRTHQAQRALAVLPLGRPALARAPWVPARPVRIVVGVPPGGGAGTGW